MTARSVPAPLLLKETRALAPIWLAAATAIWASAASGFLLGGLAAFALGAAALGAFSVGHEYVHRTLPMLLAQPLDRTRLLLSKVTVLAPLLLLLSVVAWFALLRADGIEWYFGQGASGLWWRRLIVSLTPLLGLCIAPWLTMICRSAVAGMVFTLAIPAALWIAGQMARAAWAGFDTRPLEYSPGTALMAAGLLTTAAIGAAWGRATFLRLEAIDAPREIWRAASKPAQVAALSLRRRHPLVQLLRKELRLHSLVFVVAGLYALGWMAMSAAHMELYVAGQSFQALAGLYSIFVALLTGALASAEERALGTCEWQALQPYAAWKQWTIKVVTAVALAVTLGVGVASLLEWLLPLMLDSRTGSTLIGTWTWRIPSLHYWMGAIGDEVATVTLIVLIGLFLSSLCHSGLRALLLALPFASFLSWLYVAALTATWRFEELALRTLYPDVREPQALFYWTDLPTADTDDFRLAGLAGQWLLILAVTGFMAMLLRHAYRNHRSAQEGGRLVIRQTACLTLYVVGAGILIRGGPSVILWILVTH